MKKEEKKKKKQKNKKKRKMPYRSKGFERKMNTKCLVSDLHSLKTH